MDISRFSVDAPGEVVGIGGGEHAFIPAMLPPRWSVSPELWPVLAESRQQVGILEGLGRNLPNPTILLRSLEDREAIKSSQLEGTYATPRELLLFEMEPQEAVSENDPVNSRREVFNYRRALHEALGSALPLSLRLIRDLHATLLQGVRGRDRSPGEFRKIQVAIGATSRFVPPPPDKLMECLDPLEKYLHAESLFDPLVDCFLVHYQFESIHPFVDGNGRVGRLLLSLMLQQRCGASKPWLYMSEYFEQHKEEYIQCSFNVSTRADWGGWVGFCIRGVLQQATATIARCEKLLAIRERFTQRINQMDGSVRLHQIVEDIFYSPYARVVDVRNRLSVTYPTAKADLERLVEAGILKELEGVSPKTYYAPEVFDVAYEKLD